MEFSYTLTNKELDTLSKTYETLSLALRLHKMDEDEAAMRIIKKNSDGFLNLIFNIREQQIVHSIRSAREKEEDR